MEAQYIRDENGDPQYVVIPYDVYFKMRLQMADVESESEAEGLEEIPFERDEYDDVSLPDEIVSIMCNDEVSLQAAWRIYNGLSQQDVAQKLGISQSAVSQLESPDSRPQKRTREKLAAIYGCTQAQISLLI